MPSFLLGQPLASGAQITLSGWPFSGVAQYPQGGVQLRLHPNASGFAYYGYSGGMTLNSGGYFMSGGGLLDGVLMAPGDTAFVPRMAAGLSGNLSIYFRHDVACSGQARMYWEVYSWFFPIGIGLLQTFLGGGLGI